VNGGRSMSKSRTIYVSIGNSDDKLSQGDWSSFCTDIDRAISRACRYNGTAVHGRWYSLPNEQWQNACWGIEVDDACAFVLDVLREDLARACKQYQQTSIAWAEGTTAFITAANDTGPANTLIRRTDG
jgi:hypothetical protein